MRRMAPAFLALALTLLVAAPAAAAPRARDRRPEDVYALGVALARELEGFPSPRPNSGSCGRPQGRHGRQPADRARAPTAEDPEFAKARDPAAAGEEAKEPRPSSRRGGGDGGREDRLGADLLPQGGHRRLPKATDTVKVHYHGTLRDGTVFDSSVDRGTPAGFRSTA